MKEQAAQRRIPTSIVEARRDRVGSKQAGRARSLLKRALWVSAFALLSASPALPLGLSEAEAQSERGEDAASSRSTAFRAVSGPKAESISGGVLLISAYAVAWLLVMLYLLRLGRLATANRSELERLERVVATLSLAQRGATRSSDSLADSPLPE